MVYEMNSGGKIRFCVEVGLFIMCDGNIRRVF